MSLRPFDDIDTVADISASSFPPSAPSVSSTSQIHSPRWMPVSTPRWVSNQKRYLKVPSTIPAVFRPRPTWRYVLSTAVILYIFYCFLFSMPLFASNLPNYAGPYQVGAIDIEQPLPEPRRVSQLKFRNSNEYAFEVETVLFTLYYPAQDAAISQKSKHYWIPKPIALTAAGYAKFAHVNTFIINKIFTAALGVVAGGITIPAKVDVPLHPPSSSFVPTTRLFPENTRQEETVANTDLEKLPVLVFSHGMTGSRTDYTHYCGELASRGYVVVALEHRDGSCPGTVIMKKGSPDKWRYPIRLYDLDPNVESVDSTASLSLSSSSASSASPSSVLDSAALKQAQLDFREAEIEAAVSVIRKINDGDDDEVFTTNLRHEGTHLFPSWAGRLDTERMTIGGHSFGATGALQALRGGPSYARPFYGGFALDPGKSSGPLNTDVRVPLLVVHSDSWSSSVSIFYGRPHFEVVRDLVEGVNCSQRKDTDKVSNDRATHGLQPPDLSMSSAESDDSLSTCGAWFITSLGTSHPSVTDAPLIEPLLLSWTTGATIDVREAVRQYVHVTRDFMSYQHTGTRRGLLALGEHKNEGGREGSVVMPDFDPGKARTNENLPKRWRKYWQIHVAPNVD